MKRIFQDNHGNIEELQGKEITSFYSLRDNKRGSVYLLWIGVSNGMFYRIFIDGWYCGVDEYNGLFFEDDLDDGITSFDHFSELKSTIVQKACVTEPKEDKRHIVLVLELENQRVELICKSVDGDCFLCIN